MYILVSTKNSKIYIGSTSDLKKRFASHNNGENLSTKRDVPWELTYYEAYSTHKLAISREKKLKRYGKSLAMLKKRIGLAG